MSAVHSPSHSVYALTPRLTAAGV
eukprot:SAG11_NODE_22570_length_403_cov_2.194079_1_plen_23_part_01